MNSKLNLILSAACLVATLISSALFADSPAKLPWNGDSHLSAEKLKIHHARAAVKKLESLIAVAGGGSQEKPIVLETSKKANLDAKILRVSSKAVDPPIANRMLECEVEIDLDSIKENATVSFLIGMVISPTDGEDGRTTVGGTTLTNHNGHCANPTIVNWGWA